MNMEDEEEYLDFYDFSRAYIDHPLLIKEGEEEANGLEAPTVAALEYKEPDNKKDSGTKTRKEERKEAADGEQEDGDADWEDADLESMGSSEADQEAKDLVEELEEAPE